MRAGINAATYLMRPLLLLLLVLLGVSCQQTPEPKAKVPLRVLTYNIHHGRGLDGEVDLERIAEVIRTANADLVALQEVDRGTRRTSGLDIAKELGRLTNMQFVFAKNIDFQGGEYGNAILSRYQIQDSSNQHYRMIREGEQRGMLRATIRLADRKIVFASTHLDHRSDPTERISNVDEIKEFLSQQKSPVILAGDFNDRPDGAVHQELTKVFIDVWESAGLGDSHTFSSDNPRSRIDYIFLSPKSEWDVRNASVIESQASDHLPLLAEIVLVD